MTDRYFSLHQKRVALLGDKAKAKRADRLARSRAPAKKSSRQLWREAWAKINAEQRAVDRE